MPTTKIIKSISGALVLFVGMDIRAQVTTPDRPEEGQIRIDSGFYEADEGDAMWESSFLEGREAVGILVSTAKARVVLGDPSKEGQVVDFMEISPYILINGESPLSIGQLETRAGYRLVSLGSYPSFNSELGGEIEWGERVGELLNSDAGEGRSGGPRSA